MWAHHLLPPINAQKKEVVYLELSNQEVSLYTLTVEEDIFFPPKHGHISTLYVCLPLYTDRQNSSQSHCSLKAWKKGLHYDVLVMLGWQGNWHPKIFHFPPQNAWQNVAFPHLHGDKATLLLCRPLLQTILFDLADRKFLSCW